MPATIDNVLRWWGTERADQAAVSFSGDAVTYAALNAWVGRVAARFARDGLGMGGRVAIYAANSLEWWVAALAAMRCGGITCGIHTNMVMAEVAYLLGDYAPVLLVADEPGAERLRELGELVSKTGEPVAPPKFVNVSELTALRQGAPDDVKVDGDPDAPVAIVTTSGSTARPKGVMYSSRSMIDYNTDFTLQDPLGEIQARMLVVAPFSVSAGIVLLTQMLLQGGTAYIEPRFEAERALELIHTEKLNMFCGAPVFFQRVADLPEFATTDVSSVRIAHTGGAAVAVKLLKAWADKGVLVRQIYGQTECGGNGVINPRRYALTHPDKCGHGSILRDVAIIDDNGDFLPHGQVGQIVLRGHGMMLGYWNNPEATAQTIVNGWLRTGDLGVIDELGLLKFVDRLKDMIISGGLNISAAEVERVILEVPGVEEAAVVAAPDEKFGETPFAIVYAPRPVEIEALIAHCDKNLSKHKVPRYLVLSEAPLPRLAAGKISKVALRQRYLKDQPLPPRVR